MKTVNQDMLLRKILDGSAVFSPGGETEEEMRAFQATAQELIELHRNGLIEMNTPIKENRTGHNFIVRIFGLALTYSGRTALDENK